MPTPFSPRKRYSAWDGSQQPAWDADEVLKALADDLIEYGDLRWAMRNLMSRGMQMPQGGYMQGLRDMIRQLKEQKQRQLKRFNLDSIFEDFRERLDEIVQMERERIDEWKQKAEDPDNFRPSPGKITTFHPPGGPGIRMDTACYAEAVVPPYYDSMIAKVVARGNTRGEAILRMRRALDSFVVEGIRTNLPLQQKILREEDFVRGRFSTAFMERFLEPEGESVAG